MNDRIKERIGKLLKIAEDSPYPAEVETALLKAQRLMVENDLAEGDLNPSDRGDVTEIEIDLGGRAETWKKCLALLLAENFRCMAYTRRRLMEPENGGSSAMFTSLVVILGRSDDARIAFDAFCRCVIAVSRFALEYRERSDERWQSIRSSYFMGFVRGLEDRFEEQRKNNSEWGLVLVRDGAVDSAYEALELKSVTSRTVLHGEQAFAVGYATGKGFALKDDPSLKNESLALP